MANNKHADDWTEIPVEHAADDWHDVTEDTGHGLANTALVQGAAGFTAGLDDELGGGVEALGKALGIEGLGGKIKDVHLAKDGPTLDLEKLKEAYKGRRDTIRQMKDEMQQEHPGLSATAQIAGSIANPVARGASTLKGLAGLGALQGFGDSKSDSAGGIALDTLEGGGIGLGTGLAGKYVVAPALRKGGELLDKVVQGAASKSPTVNKALAKLANIASNVDEDAALRQIERPGQAAAAEADGFAYNTGKKAVAETEARGQMLGQAVDEAKQKFLSNQGDDFVRGAGNDLSSKINDFLDANKPSQKGFSALNDSQVEELKALSSKLRMGEMTGEDLVKVRDYLDHVEKLATKYEAEAGPYTNFLKNLRHEADGVLDKLDPNIDKANQSFAQFKGDTGLLRSATNEGQAESMINNLYGGNKGAQQEAAGRLFSPDTMESAKDIASNKAFENAKRPGGDNYFRRMALAALTFGTSELATNSNNWKTGLRYMGKVEQAVRSNPQALGKFSGVLANAAQRGPQAMAATHFILSQQNADYRQLMKNMDKGDE